MSAVRLASAFRVVNETLDRLHEYLQPEHRFEVAEGHSITDDAWGVSFAEDGLDAVAVYGCEIIREIVLALGDGTSADAELGATVRHCEFAALRGLKEFAERKRGVSSPLQHAMFSRS